MELNIFLITFLISSYLDTTICYKDRNIWGRKVREPRIIGGGRVNIADTPYQISIFSKQKSNPFCGGAIISKIYILTAAHCIEDEGPYGIVAGSDIYRQGSKHLVAKILVHPLFNEKKPRYDIAILTLSHQLSFSRTIKKISLPARNAPIREGSLALVTGFGATIEEGYMTNRLKGVHVPISSNDECERVEMHVPDTFCAGYKEGERDACQGDSGGPLVFKEKLIGIVSFGTGCGRANSPGVYTNVAKYIDFIMSETNYLRGYKN